MSHTELDPPASALSRRGLLLGAAAGAAGVACGGLALESPAAHADPRFHPYGDPRVTPLWRLARRHGLIYGSSTATWQLSDEPYAHLFDEQAEILFTEDDLLWYRLKPTPTSKLDFRYADRVIAHAEKHKQLVMAAHLVWDEGYGDGWPEDYLWKLPKKKAEELLYGTAKAMVKRYRGRVAGWITANEVTDPEGKQGLRTDVPWFQTIGAGYVREMFTLAHHYDPHATLVLNEFGFETVNEYGDSPYARQKATLQVIDGLRKQHAPVHALGVQAHLSAVDFAHRFNAKRYRHFLDEVAHRGLNVIVTELDVLDDGLPAKKSTRDRGVAEVYKRYLDVVVGHPAVRAVISFGLSDRYSWLAEDYPRDDEAPRRPLFYDENLAGKPSLGVLRRELDHARYRRPLWRSKRR